LGSCVGVAICEFKFGLFTVKLRKKSTFRRKYTQFTVEITENIKSKLHLGAKLAVYVVAQLFVCAIAGNRTRIRQQNNPWQFN